MTEVVVNPQLDEYRVDLAVFHGPLDLLLYLIRKEEVDIYDIPIARITRQYLKYVEMMQTLNLEVAGEFILMAATLIRIKTRLLLPRDEEDGEEGDPREELIMALIEYKKYKEAGDILHEKAIFEERNYVPDMPLGKLDHRIEEYSDISLFDLISAFKDVLSAKHDEVVHEVDVEEISIEERMEIVMLMLRQKEYATFQDLLADLPRRIVAVVTFVALLELARARRITISQSQPFSELRVYRGERFEARAEPLDLVHFNDAEPEVIR